MYRSRAVAPVLAGTLVAVLAGCSAASGAGTTSDSGGHGVPAGRSLAGAEVPKTVPASPVPRASAPRVLNATLTIPSIDITALRVVPYKGTTDDWPGTHIQDRGIAASPYGPRGGVGPGQVGNYLVTAHRLSAGGPLNRLPSLHVGESVVVTAGGKTYTYKVTESRITSFRSPRSLAEQRAAVPGFPGKEPTRAMITLSTCATPEDNAAGNFWRDSRDNPEHRVDKVGVLVKTEPAAHGPSSS